ncbi:MAG: fasciclin domain-containing protein [Myxococcaceae bacterium]|nr:fasciclin domain-containing protein [Myxococcaceae bacterium]
MKLRMLMGGLLAATVLVACAGSSGSSSGGGSGSATGGGTGATGGGSAGGGSAMPGTVVDVAAGNPDFSSLVAAVQKAGLATTLADTSKQYTVFAPTNAAFAALLTKLGAPNLDALSAEQLKPILLYHVLGSKVDAAAATTAAQGNQKVSALGGKIQLSLQGTTIRLDAKASVTAADVAASNGVIHVIDQVILPSALDIVSTDARFSSLAAAVAKADTATPSPGFLATLDDDGLATKVTVFAPTNDGFTALVSALKGSDDGAKTGITALGDFRADQLVPVIAYHVIGSPVFAKDVPASGQVDTLGGKVAVTRSGTTVTVDAVPVAVADIVASNAVIHAVGSVLLPSITDIVTTSPRFTALKGAVVAADGASGTTPKVAGALDGSSTFTLFAPTNAAFTALGTAPTGQDLTNVLLYHAAPGAPVYAATALALTSPLTVSTAFSGKSFAVNAEGAPKGVTVADSTATKAKVTDVNYFAANGVIHAIDKVLIP